MGVANSWRNYHGENTFVMTPQTTEKLPSGVYSTYENSNGEIVMCLQPQKGDQLFELPGLPIKFISDQIDRFWSATDLYTRYKFVQKRGVIIYGPPGNGKTCVIASLIKNLMAQDGVIITVKSFVQASKALSNIKETEPTRKVMTIMEDMDTLLSGDSKVEEQAALAMLDGQAQVGGVVHIATTNYPEQLADRFIKRPGRFDLVVGMGMPVKETRRAYFELILNDKNHPQIDLLVDKTEGLSLAYLREIASTYLCLGIPIEETVARVKKNFTDTIKSKGGNAVGFQIGYDSNSGHETMSSK